MNDKVVLCYHSLREGWPATLNVKPDEFERQIGLMLERGYEATTFSRLVNDPPGSKLLAVTFDDAFGSVLELGVPILQRYGIPATVFAVSSFADRGGPLCWEGIDNWADGPHADALTGMTWAELRSLIDLGWEVGSHTVTHPKLTTLSDAQLQVELADSRRDCEHALGVGCESVAYPYGDVDARVVRAAQAAGYSAGAALPASLHPERALEWPRIGVWWNDDLRRFKIKVSRPVRRARLLARR